MNNVQSPSCDGALVEQAIQAAGKTAPRITPQDIEAAITAEYFHRPPGTTLTLCVLTLRNGFTVTGESACASPENFDPAIGQRLARSQARDKIWMLEGYLLKEQLFQRTQPAFAPE